MAVGGVILLFATGYIIKIVRSEMKALQEEADAAESKDKKNEPEKEDKKKEADEPMKADKASEKGS